VFLLTRAGGDPAADSGAGRAGKAGAEVAAPIAARFFSALG